MAESEQDVTVKRRSVGAQAVRGVGMAMTLILLVSGAGLLIVAGLVARWCLQLEEMAAMMGIVALVVVALPLGLLGLGMLGAGLRGVGALRGEDAAVAAGTRRVRPFSLLGFVLLLLGAAGVVAWVVVFDRMTTAGWVIGGVLAVLGVIGLIARDRGHSA